MAELSAQAGVHRTSFYSHASSPTELLVDLLVEELAPEIEELIAGLRTEDADFSAYWRSFYRVIMSHVQERPDIYRQAVNANSALLNGMQEHYLAWVEQSLALMTPAWSGMSPTHLWLEMAKQQQSSDLRAVITAWVRTGLKAPINQVLDDYWTLAPPWQLAKRSSDGTVRMRRRTEPTGT